jgi:hypothetical protein
LAVDREADFDADFSDAFRLLLDCEVLSFLFVAIVTSSSLEAKSRPYRGTIVLTHDNDSVAVQFARTSGQKWEILSQKVISRFVSSSGKSASDRPQKNTTLL